MWNHNGSTMYLVASGATRQCYYEEPRPGMQQAGAQKGSLLFTGQYWSAEQPAVETQMSCFGGALSWQATVLWTVRTIDSRRHLSVTTLRTTNTRDDGGQPIANSNSPTNAEFLECR